MVCFISFDLDSLYCFIREIYLWIIPRIHSEQHYFLHIIDYDTLAAGYSVRTYAKKSANAYTVTDKQRLARGERITILSVLKKCWESIDALLMLLIILNKSIPIP